jgi:ABC-type glutathione transport system ATPase component
VPTLDAIPSGCRFHPRCEHCFEPCTQILPALIEQDNNRQVRCHLYPENDQPPPLPLILRAWNKTENSHEILLEVSHLGVGFRTNARWKNELAMAVNGLSFSIKKGETLALVGESGCGKTTTARAIVGLLPHTEGKILYKQHSIANMATKSLKSQIQMVFQDPFTSMNPRMTVGEIIGEGMVNLSCNRKQKLQRQLELLDQVNLPQSSLSRYPHQFSGGQRQRICIARALATNPELLILDEPTSALDISVQAQILNLLKRLQIEYGLSYLFITHNMAVVSYIADQVLVMKEGRKIEQGTTEMVFQNPQQEYTQQLLAGVLPI